MPDQRLRNRTTWLVQRDPEVAQIDYIMTDAPDIVDDLRWMNKLGWRVALVGMNKAGIGMFCSFLDSETLAKLPDVKDVHTTNCTFVDAGPVEDGESIMAKAAQGWQNAFKNKGETMPILHSLAVQFGQALVKENGNIKLCLAWVNNNLFARHYAETLLGRRIKHTLEKAKCDALVAAAGALDVDVASLLHSNVELQCIPVELKSKGSNDVQLRGSGSNKVYVDFGSKVWLNNKGVKAAAEAKKAVWVIADAFPTTSGGIYYLVAVVGWKTLVDLVETGKLYNAGREIPKVQPNPDYLRYGKKRYDKPSGKMVNVPQFVSTEPRIQCGATNVVYKRDAIGRYQEAPAVDTSKLFFDDIKECCRNDDVKGAILVEGGAADSVIEAIRTVKDVDNIETITIKDANLDTHVESWVRSVLLAEGMLGDLVIGKNSFTEFKWHNEYKCDDEALGMTVSTLTLTERNQLTFIFNSQTQHASVELEQKDERQPLPYHISACLVTCRAFTQADLNRLGIRLPQVRVNQLGGFPITAGYVLPTDVASYSGGIAELASKVYVDLDDFEAKLLGRRLPPKRDRSGLKKLLNDSFFCRKIDFQRLALDRGRTYVSWRDGTCGKVPGIPDVEPAKFDRNKRQTTFQDEQPTMTDPGEFDGLDFDNGWGAARVRRLAVASEVDEDSSEVEWKLEDESDYLERVQQLLERDAEEEDEDSD